jgi:site-specific recombinase XerC
MLKSYIDNNEHSAKLFDFSESYINKLMKDKASMVGISKRIYPHLLRHTRTTELARFLTDREMCVYFGWWKNSRMPGYYSHLSFKDLDAKILELNGIR